MVPPTREITTDRERSSASGTPYYQHDCLSPPRQRRQGTQYRRLYGSCPCLVDLQPKTQLKHHGGQTKAVSVDLN